MVIVLDMVAITLRTGKAELGSIMIPCTTLAYLKVGDKDEVLPTKALSVIDMSISNILPM